MRPDQKADKVIKRYRGLAVQIDIKEKRRKEYWSEGKKGGMMLSRDMRQKHAIQELRINPSGLRSQSVRELLGFARTRDAACKS